MRKHSYRARLSQAKRKFDNAINAFIVKWGGHKVDIVPHAAVIEPLEIRQLLSDASTWLVIPTGASASWSDSAQILTINTGTVTIRGNPGDSGDNPTINETSSSGQLLIDTQTADNGTGASLVQIAAISGGGNTTVIGTNVLVAGVFNQSALVNSGAIEIDGSGTIGQVSGDGTTTFKGTNLLVTGSFYQSLQVNNGDVQIDGDAAIAQLAGTGNLTIGNGSSDNTVQLTAAATADSVTDTQTAINLSGGSTLDITNHIVLLNYGNYSTPLAAVRAAVADGTIISSTISSGFTGQYAIGYADSTELGSVPGGNVEVMFTLGGDANLDGAVNFSDYSILQNHYNQTGADWSQGDFNHDGVVNFEDYSILQNNYNRTLGPSGAATTLTYILSVNDDGAGNYCAGHYAVYASDATNNGGLASYDIGLAGAKTITNYSPKGTYDDGTGCGNDDAIGFTFARTGPNNSPAMASQDTIDYANGGGVALAYGLGQTAGNLASDALTGSTGADGDTTQAVYGAPVLLVKGTFTGSAPTFTDTADDTGNVFVTNTGYTTEAPVIGFNTTTLGPPTVTIAGNASATQGIPYTLTLSATYPPADGGLASIQSWTINWGDGSTSSPDTQTVSGNVTSVNHTYESDLGNATISATATDANGTYATAPMTITVTDTITPQAGGVVGSSPGQAFSGVVADFTDSASDAGNQTYTASINWGDGSTNSPQDDTTVSVISDGDGGFEVIGNHTYSTAGLFNATVIVQAGDGRTATMVTEADVSTLSGSTQPITVEAGNFSGTVATFTDSTGNNDPTQYTASIDWFGDGSDVTTGTVISDGNGTFTVTGNNTFASSDSLNLVVTVTDTSNGGTLAAVVPGSLTQPAPTNVSATLVGPGFGEDMSEYDVTFDGPSGPFSHWPASMAAYGGGYWDWFAPSFSRTDDPYGVMSASIGNLLRGVGMNATGQYEGTLYLADNPCTVSLTIAHCGNQNNEMGPVDSPPSTACLISVPGTQWSPLQLTATPDGSGNVTLSWTGGHDLDNDVVQIFLANAGPAAPGQATEVGFPVPASDGQAVVSAGNTGQSFFAIEIENAENEPWLGGPYSNFVHADCIPAPAVAASGDTSALQGGNYTLNLSATYPSGGLQGAIQSWTIDWGDGNASQPDIETVGNVISWQHVFAPDVTTATVTATATDADGTYSATPITVAISQTLTPKSGIVINAVSGQPYTGVVADFTDSAADAGNQTYTATINWGDGNTSAETAQSDNNGRLEVVGTNKYAVAGNYTATVTIQATDKRTLTIETQSQVTAASGPPSGSTWTSIFDDNFSGTTLDSHWTVNAWGTNTYGGNVSVSGNNTLQLTADVLGNDTKNNYEAMINTGNTTGNATAPFSFTYGYAQMTAQVPAGYGIWPGFWMMPMSNISPDGSAGEIDAYEGQGIEPDIDFTTYHWGEHGQQLPADNGNNIGVDLSQAYHTYGVDWEPTGITWYLDGKTIGSQISDPTPIDPDPMYLILDVWLGGWDQTYGNTTSGTMDVKNVQVWQKTYSAASKLVFVIQPTIAPLGLSMAPVAVAIEDVDGNVVGDYSGNVTLSLSSGSSGNLSGNLSVAPVNGVAVFSNLTVSPTTPIGNYTFAANETTGNLPTITSTTFAAVPGWIDPEGTGISWDNGSKTLTVNGNGNGDAWIDGDPSQGGDTTANVVNNGSLEVDATGNLTIGNVTGTGTTTVDATGNLTVGNFTQAGLVNSGNTTIEGAGVIGQLTGNGSLIIGDGTSDNTVQLASNATPDSVDNAQGSLTINTGSHLDITNNVLFIDYGNGSSPLTAMQHYLGNGSVSNAIYSSAAIGNSAYTVTYADGNSSAFVPAGNVMIRYTLAGNATTVISPDYPEPIMQGMEVTLTGNVTASGTTLIPSFEQVQITISGDGITAIEGNATVGPAGSFSIVLDTSTLPGNSIPYNITYSYAGNGTFSAATLDYGSPPNYGNDLDANLVVMPLDGNGTEAAVYRLYSPVTFEHLYTTDFNEYTILATRGWQPEATAYYVYNGLTTIGVVTDEPFFRLYTANYLQHLWTTDFNEWTTLAEPVWDWIPEEVMGYIFPTSVPNSEPLYRLTAPNVHLWTTDLNEVDTLTESDDWTLEGIAGYVM